MNKVHDWLHIVIWAYSILAWFEDIGALKAEVQEKQFVNWAFTHTSELDLRKLCQPFEPLSRGHYPILNQYPKFVVDYRKRETEKIKKREIDILREKSTNLGFEATSRL